jgi:RecA/RadA recombinase
VHAEIFSEVEHVGKTSFSLGVGVTWQMKGLKVGIVDIEPSITPDYLRQLKYITSKEEAEKKSKELGYTIYPVRLLRPKVKPEQCETEMVYVEEVLNVVSIAANVFDLLIIDSVDALVSEADAAKTSEQPDQMGGVAKPIKSFMRKNTSRKSACIWINHQSQGLGMYAKSYTTGGKAIPRYSTIRLKLDRVEFLRETDKGDPIGFTTKVSTIKNRLAGGIGKSTNLSYIFGEGFSVDYDYFMTALGLGIITKKGGWFFVGTDKENSKLTVQGQMNMYKALKEDPELFTWVKQQVDGKDSTVALADEELTDEQRLESLDVDVDELEEAAA